MAILTKKGQIAPTTIVSIILVIGALILGLLFYFGIFGNKDLEQRDLCRLSILSRATLPGVTQQAVPLNCRTDKICITTGKSAFSIFGDKKSDCEQFAGEKNVRDVSIDVSNPTKAREEIEKLYADTMYNCWLMTGQGKLDVFRGTTDGAGTTALATLAGIATNLDKLIIEVKPQCIVCSRLAISNELVGNDSLSVLSGLNFNKYLATEKVPDGSGLTYLQKFTDESVNGFAPASDVDLSSSRNNTGLLSRQLAIIFMQIKFEGNSTEIGKEAALLTGTTIAGAVFTSPVGKVVPGGTIGGAVLTLAGAGFAYLAAENIVESNQGVTLAACNKYQEDKEKALAGCSLIKPVKWDVKEVNSLCFGGIEGNL